MSFIQFSKSQLHDLDFSLKKEILQANETGAYCCSSLINCNTRKYHGLLVAKQPQLGDAKYVMLASLDETIVKGKKKIQLSTHAYPDIHHPKGYAHIKKLVYEKIPEWKIAANDVLIQKEILLVQKEARILIRYRIKKAPLPFQMQFDPFLAFRNIHTIGKCNLFNNAKSEKVDNGIKFKLYDGFSDLYLQFSKKVEFIAAPDWHYNNEYKEEKDRGYEYREDLFTPGYFNIAVKNGDEFLFSAGLTEISPRGLKRRMESELETKIPLNGMDNCLKNAASQFILRAKDRMEITAGFPWFGTWGRDTFIALPGLTLSTRQLIIFKAVVNTMLKDLKNGLFPNLGTGNNAVYNSADASLWFFWSLQQYAIYTAGVSSIWTIYGDYLKSILEHYRFGTLHNIYMLENGLLHAGEEGIALTWMDAVVNGMPVTPRMGLAVELNALWYNAIKFSLEAASFSNDTDFIKKWEDIPSRIEKSFTETFWSEEKKYLADCVTHDQRDWSLRPNQIFAVSLPYSPVTYNIQKAVLNTIEEKLLTTRGLRTLSPDDKQYHGIYSGDQQQRDQAYHQGTVWPWLLGHFLEAYLKVNGEMARPFLELHYNQFEAAVQEYGIATIAEIYDGNPPHLPRGAISQAWSVAELLRIKSIIDTGSEKEIQRTRKKENASISKTKPIKCVS